MGVAEESGKVATTTVEALKTNPSCLAAIVLAALFAVLTFLALQLDQERKTASTMALIKSCVASHSRGADD